MKNFEYKKDRAIVKVYFNSSYPKYLHDIGLYDTVNYFAGLCSTFIKELKNLNSHINIFAGDNRAYIEHKMVLLDDHELYCYYANMLKTLRILKKYYNEDGTLKEKYK